MAENLADHITIVTEHFALPELPSVKEQYVIDKMAIILYIPGLGICDNEKGDDPEESSPFSLFFVIVLPLVIFIRCLIGTLATSVGNALYLFIRFNIVVSAVSY
ncbi:hypothetical protein [Pedobacter suwonensis]|uniref:hypothetical protein n=1 Tax=Pedobacter suwonensis TaxID=332999 RepID=UPI0036C57B12